MAGKRKRNRSGIGIAGDAKRQRTSGQLNTKNSIVKEAVLAQYYSQVVSLRQYLISKLPPASKIRKKKILSFGRNKVTAKDSDNDFSDFLDGTLIGVRDCIEVSQLERVQQWQSYSQHVDASESTFGNLTGVGIYSQSEVCESR